MFIVRWILSKLGTNWDLVTWVAGLVWTAVGGVVTGWAAAAADIFPRYAPLSWVAFGLGGAFVSAGIFWLAAKATFWLMQARWARMWASPGDGVNPLEDNFVRKRIKLNDFVSPVHQIIEGKVFDRCEIIGPALVMMGSNFHNPQFYDSNFVCVKDNILVYNATQVLNCSFINCKFYRLTVIVAESTVGGFPKVPWLSRTPAEFGSPVPWEQPTT